MNGCPSAKQTYRTYTAARQVSRRIHLHQRHLGRSHIIAEPYHCRYCHGWHLSGHGGGLHQGKKSGRWW